MTEERGLSFGKQQSAPTTAEFANNRAYVIGVNAYSNGIRPLRTAVADAERLGQLLAESHGYIVRSFPRDGAPSLAAIRELLHETLPQEVGPKDRVLFYFAGHGIALDGDDGPEGFLVPEDANREDRSSFLAMTELHDALASLPCRHLLLILDCCFAGAFRWSSTRDLSALPSVIHRERYERYIQDPAWQVLTSAAYDQTALDVLSGNTIGERIETAEHSPFAAALFRALEGDADLIPRGKDGQPGGDGVITATELYLYLRECVETATVERRMRQTPGLWPLRKHDKGEYILLSPGHELNLPPAPELNYANNPYRGLQSFEEEHRQLFFGRTRIVDQLYGLVASQPLTVVLGASGTGKSSVVKAGLLPHLRGMDNEDWEILPVIRPGKSPLATLASLTLPGEDNAIGEAERLNALRLDENAFAERVRTWADAPSPGARLVFVVDQLEELITLCWDDWERKHFIKTLAAAVDALPDGFRLILTLRSDFEPQFADCPLKSDWKASRYVVPPMTTDELREAIEGPASVRVLYFQPADLVDRLIDEVVQTPGAMPLLSFTLSELYVRYLERRGDDRCLTAEDYERLGGVVGSLRSRATELYDKLDAPHQATMKRIMLRMVVAQGGELARRRVPRSELAYSKQEENEHVATILQQLSESRLIVEGKEADGERYVEPAHDALVRGWTKLLQWTREEQEQLTLRHLVNPAANDWKAAQGGLWSFNPRLSLLRLQLRRSNGAASNASGAHTDGWLNAVEAEFIERSVRRRRNTLGTILGTLLLAFATLAALTRFAFYQRDRAEENLRVMTREANNIQVSRVAIAWRDEPILARLWLEDETLCPVELRDFTWHLLHRVTDQVRLRLQGHHGRIFAVACSRDGNRIASAAQDGTVRLWDAWTGETRETIPTDLSQVRHIEFSPNGDGLFLAGRDPRIEFWDIATKARKAVLEGHLGQIRSISVSPSGDLFASASDDDTIRLWQQQGETFKHSETRGCKGVLFIQFQGNSGELLAFSDNGTFIRWDGSGDIEESKFVSEASKMPLRNVACSRDQKTLAVIDDSNRLSILSLPEFGSQREIELRSRYGNGLVFSPDGSLLAVGMNRQILLVPTDAPTRKPVALQDHKSGVVSLAFSPDGKRLVSGAGGVYMVGSITHGPNLTNKRNKLSPSELVVWAVQADETSLTLRHEDLPGAVTAISFSPDGATLATLLGTQPLESSKFVDLELQDSSVVLWEVSTARQMEVLKPTGVEDLAYFSENGGLILASQTPNELLEWIPLSSKPPVSYGRAGYAYEALSVHQGRRLVAAVNNNGTIDIFDLSRKSLLRTLLAHVQRIGYVEFSPSGNLLASVGRDNIIRVWNPDTAQLLAESPIQPDTVSCLAFSPVGDILLSACHNAEIHVWRIPNMELVQIVRGHSIAVSCVAFSPDGETLASSDYDGTVILWDGRRFRPKLSGATGQSVFDVEFSPDGRVLAIAGNSGEVLLWDSRTQITNSEQNYRNPTN